MSPLIICLVFFASGVFARNNVRLSNNVTLPLHYEVQLTIDVVAQKFFVEESIRITVLKDTTEIQLNSKDLEGAWMKSRLVASDGKVLVPTEAITESDRYSDVLTLRFGESVPGDSNYTLHLTEIEGTFGSGLIVVPVPNNYLLTTGFNTTNLRSVFPCFDQPEFKTTFTLIISYPPQLKLIANLDGVITEVPNQINSFRQRISIQTPLSTSSIGFALTFMDADYSSDDRVRVHHPNSNIRHYLLNTYHKLLLGVEEELGVSGHCPKLDIIYAPNFPSQTLTKWGLIMVNEEMSPVERSAVHSVQLKEIQKEIARSVYQMFFGQLITPKWWTYQWVTLGLARFYSGVTKHLSFDTEKEFVVDTVQKVIREHTPYTDGYLEEKYLEVDRVNQPSMFVVDQRAGALMRMFANIIGRDNFQAAVLNLLSHHKFKTINTTDFAYQLTKFTKLPWPLPKDRSWEDLISKYTSNRPSSEILNIGYKFRANTSIEITRAMSEQVDLPIDYMTETISKASAPKMWMPDELSNIYVDDIRDPWIVINPDQYGLYRVSYNDEMWMEFARQLQVNHTRFNRGQLIADSGTQADHGYSKLKNHLFLVQYLKNETDTFVWRAARIAFERLLFHVRSYPKKELFYNFYNDLAGMEYMRHRIGNEMLDFEKTMEVAKITCYSNYFNCIADVEQFYKQEMQKKGKLTGSRDFQQFIYCTLAKFGSDPVELSNTVLDLWIKDRSTAANSRTAIQGLACTANTTIIARFLDLAAIDSMEADYGVVLTQAERLFLFHSFMHGSYESVIQSLEYIRDNFVVIANRLASMKDLFAGIRNFISSPRVTDLLVDIQKLEVEAMTEELRKFINWEEVVGLLNRNDAGYFQSQFDHFLEEVAPARASVGNPKNTLATSLIGMILWFKSS